MKKIPGAGLGAPLSYNPLNSDIIYCTAGLRYIFISRDRGYTWQNYGVGVTNGGVIKSIDINPLDTMQLLVGVELSGSPDEVEKSTDGGQTWNVTWTGSFNYFGKPVEFKPEHDDTVYTMSNDTVFRSTDFGSTWGIASIVTGQFNSWCDAEERPDSANIILVGDDASGIWKSKDYGATWKLVYSTIGEIPCIAIDPFHPRTAYASKFSGGGGMLKTTDGGDTWQPITTPIGTGNSWWVTTSRVSPGYVYFGTYGAGPYGPFMSRDGGTTWQQIASVDSGQTFNQLNYDLLCTDTLTVLALQANGIWKLKYPQYLQLANGFGGEYLHAGTERTIQWADSNVEKIIVQLTTDNGATWDTIATPSPGTDSLNWIVPPTPSTQCRIRVFNPYNTSILDQSDTTFTIYTNPLTVLSPNGGEMWFVGTSHIISWISGVPLTLNLELTTDNGVKWQHISTLNPNTYSFNWVIPTMSNYSECRVRISDVNDSTTTDMSDSTFTILSYSLFSSALTIKGSAGELDTLTFGTAVGATDGIDTSLGEHELSPKPGAGTFDSRWDITGTNGSETDFRDTLIGTEKNIFTAELQPGPTGYPLQVTWDPATLHAGTYILRDTLTRGARILRDMQQSDSLQLLDSTETGLEIIQCRTQSLSLATPGDWQLLSVPFLTGNLMKRSVIPNSFSGAFTFSNGYTETDSLRYDQGFWVKLQQVTFTGCSRTLDTIDVGARWNIIGSLSAPVSISSIRSIPDSLVVSNYYAYNGGYQIATTLQPGQGYWVKTKGVGKLILQADSTASAAMNKEIAALHVMSKLSVRDGNGHNSAVYFGEGEENLNPELFELPPAPPQQTLDLRFYTQKMAEIIPKDLQNEIDFPILLQSGSLKNIFYWNVEFDKNFSYILTRNKGNRLVGEIRLTGSGSETIDDVSGVTFILRVIPRQEEDEPLTFSLSPNYPNPFNPATRIRFTLPYDATMTLRVVNSLGQEVSTLVQGVQDRGVHEVEWNGNDTNGMQMSSGVYYIVMNVNHGELPSAVGFSSVRAVVLLK